LAPCPTWFFSGPFCIASKFFSSASTHVTFFPCFIPFLFWSPLFFSSGSSPPRASRWTLVEGHLFSVRGSPGLLSSTIFFLPSGFPPSCPADPLAGLCLFVVFFLIDLGVSSASSSPVVPPFPHVWSVVSHFCIFFLVWGFSVRIFFPSCFFLFPPRPFRLCVMPYSTLPRPIVFFVCIRFVLLFFFVYWFELLVACIPAGFLLLFWALFFFSAWLFGIGIKPP